MNDVKFRAWDKDTRKILEVIEIDFQGMEILVIDHEEQEAREAVHGHYELMQYTGLKDRNGVDIYENDIVIFDDSERSYHGVVKAGGWYLYLDLYEADDVVNFDAFSDENDMTADIQVIGNIYENPELLGDSQ